MTLDRKNWAALSLPEGRIIYWQDGLQFCDGPENCGDLLHTAKGRAKISAQIAAQSGQVPRDILVNGAGLFQRSLPVDPFTSDLPQSLQSEGQSTSWHFLPDVSQSQPALDLPATWPSVAGYLAQDATFDGVLVLGRNPRLWARISAGELCHAQISYGANLAPKIAPDPQELDLAALEEGISHPERALSAPAHLPARAEGLALGAELALTRPYWLGQRVAVSQSNAPLAKALEHLGGWVDTQLWNDSIPAGLWAIWSGIRGA